MTRREFYIWLLRNPLRIFILLGAMILAMNLYLKTSKTYNASTNRLNKVSDFNIVKVPDRNCNITFKYGHICPKLYTELGGNCTTEGRKLKCRDIRRKGKTKLRATQLVLTRMLRIFDIMARMNNITYWITSGTLLGAARHHGFIPWDEDADIQMPLEEYIKLFKCCRRDFPRGMFFQNSESDPYLGEDVEDLERHPEVGLYKRPWNPRLRDTLSCTTYCLQYNCKWEDGIMIDIFIAEDTLTVNQTRDVFPLQRMRFEGFKFPVPNNWRQILASLYGDYDNEFGEDDLRIPQDNMDPFNSCRTLRKRLARSKLNKKKLLID